MDRIEGRILTPAGWLEGELRFERTILEFVPRSVPDGAPRVLPGFIDVHVHGGGGFDAMDGAEGVRGLARFHARHGTTALLATTITNPWPGVLEALADIRAVAAEAPRGRARVLGAHLEGPFVSPRRLGAQPPYALEPTPERVAAVLELGPRVVTLAPELPGALEAAGALAGAGVRVSLGHTAAEAEVAAAALEAALRVGGTAGGTHLFNAMGGLEGRSPGVVGALLAEPRAHAELILDGHHVHRLSFLAALAAKPQRLMFVTDATRAAGMEDGEYDLGGQAIRVEAGVARLPDGTLAGSLLTMDAAVRNAVAAGLPLERASALASAHPARYLGLEAKGRLEAGQDADLVVLGERLEVLGVYVEGERLA